MDMEFVGWQVILRLEDDRPIAPSRLDRRRLVRAVTRLAEEFHVYCWSLADTHLHLAMIGDHDVALELSRRLRIALTRVLAPRAPFQPPRIKPITDHAHSRHLFDYVLRQSVHHGTHADPWQEANCVHDILGARVGAPWFPLFVQERLPRITRAEILAPFGLCDLVERDGLDLEATLAAFTLDDLRGRGARTVAARAATVHAAPGVSSAELAGVLGVDARTVRDLRARAVPAADLRAIRRQLGFRAALAALPTAGLVSRT